MNLLKTPRARLTRALQTFAAPCAWLALAGACSLGAAPAHAQAPAAGTLIGNQASATYTDGSNVQRTVTSNVVTAMVQQVASLTLGTAQTRAVTAGGQVSFPLTLTNSGNGPDSFSLNTAQAGNLAVSNVRLHADANGDGVPDDNTSITTTGPLAPGATFKMVAVAQAPTTAVTGELAAITVQGTSAHTLTAQAAVVLQAQATTQAVITLSKAMSASSGAPGSGPYTVTLTYANVGNSPASAVVVRDALPEGMLYVPGSGRWSVLGSTALTDAADGTQGTTTTIDYHQGVSGLRTVSATLNQVPAGQTGTVSFDVTLAPFDPATGTGLLAGTLSNTGTLSYNDGLATVGPLDSNVVLFTVRQQSAASVTGQTVAGAPQGGQVAFTYEVKNLGNQTDSFDVRLPTGTFPAGTSYTLYQADGVTPLMDTNGNGVPDTGPLATGASYNVVVRLQLPANATGGPFTQTATVTSGLDATRTASATSQLTAVVASAVDLTGVAAVGAPGALGSGIGPEAVAGLTATVVPGRTVSFVLHVNNTSTVPDGYDLAASTLIGFASNTLPTGWTVQFKDAQGAPVTNTGVMQPGTSRAITLEVGVPAGQTALPAPGQTLYVRAQSPATGAVDRLTTAVTVDTVRAIQVLPNQTGQAYPGGTVVLSHVLTNTGNVTENSATSSVQLALSHSLPSFSGVIYRDLDNNGVIDPTDTVVNSAADLGALLPGASIRLLLKLTAAPGASVGQVNTTTLAATTSGLVNGAAAPAVSAAIDAVTIIAGNVLLQKDQAIDVQCDGTADTGYSPATVTVGATPGACIRYRVRVSNQGTADVLSVVISDSTPAHTTYHGTAPAAVTQGSVVAPAPGATGTVSAQVGTLVPASTVTLTFGVRINP